MREEMRLDAAAEVERIEAFIRREVQAAGRSRAVVGISGGLDSALVVSLCARALSPQNVLGYILPYQTSSRESAVHARQVCDLAGVSADTIDITPVVQAFQKMLGPEERVRLGNIMARTRMVILYDRSAAHDALVAGTGNRTEVMLGYATIHGDAACGFAPIAHLYKCQVRQLARHLGVPEEIVAKPPSADLWPGQTDEGELGFTYDSVDWLLFNMLDRGKADAELMAMGFGANFVARVRMLIAGSEFKRRLPRSLSPQ